MVTAVLRAVSAVNAVLLRFGQNIAWISLALMVVVILLQVFFRYVLNNALAWPDEAARFLMLWMTALIAPSAFRSGGFVAIDILPRALPTKLSLILTIVLLNLSLIVLVVGLVRGYTHTMGFSGNFNSSSLWMPLDLFGLESFKIKLRYMYGSLLFGVVLLVMVNIELILRAIARLAFPDKSFPDPGSPPEYVEAK